MIHGSMSGATKQIEEVLKEAREHGQFMAVVWFVDDKGTLHCKKTTWQFPTARFSEARELLGNMIDEEQNPVRRPLPLASFLKKPNAARFDSPFSLEAGAAMNEGRTILPVEPDESVVDESAPPIVNAVLDDRAYPEDGE